MSRRLSLAGQLLALQVVIICVVLVGVGAVTVAQSTKRAQETSRAGGRWSSPRRSPMPSATRRAMADDGVRYLRVAAEVARSNSGSDSVVVAAPIGPSCARRPGGAGQRFDVGDSTVLTGRSWTGDLFDGEPAAAAMAPIYARRGDPLGFVSVQRLYPSILDGLAAATPNLLTYLGLASVIGIGGSLLLARRVKRQTLGLEPAEIAGLVEHRDAMLHGIREGVVGLDLRGRVTLVNDEAIRLLRIPGTPSGGPLADLGVGEEMRDVLLSSDVERDRPVASAGRVLVLNRLPIASRGRPIGSVTTLRDRTELAGAAPELDLTRHVTDTLRAQAHEFDNRLHTIAGLIELGEADEAVRFVHRISSSRSDFSRAVTAAVRIALGRAADRQGEPGRRARRRPADRPRLRTPGPRRRDEHRRRHRRRQPGRQRDGRGRHGPERWVEVGLGLVDGEVEVVVRDSGPGVPPGMEREVFRRGVSTKDGPGSGSRASACPWCTWCARAGAGT